jgi:hypothetical protein
MPRRRENCAGGSAGAGDGGGPYSALRSSAGPALRLEEAASGASDPRLRPAVGHDAASQKRQIEELDARIGHLTVERGSLANRSGR